MAKGSGSRGPPASTHCVWPAGTARISRWSVNGSGTLLQGSLEQSNVEAVTEISNLISAQRAYEMNSKVITAADQMLQTTAQLMR